MDSGPPCVSFIGIVDFSEDACWLFVTESVSDLLGFEPHELVGRPSLELVHPDEYPQVKLLHYETINQDKAAVLAYMRLKHKDPYKGYILCAISRTVVDNVLVGGVSFASPGPKAMHNASTAQEVKIISPSAKNFEFRRWGDPSPMPPSLIPNSLLNIDIPGSPISSNTSDSGDSNPDRTRLPNNSKRSNTPSNRPGSPNFAFDPLPAQSPRTALILDRFTVNCTIAYCANDNMLAPNTAIGRSFFDFVAKKDEDVVRSWIDVIKGWGVNERGQPSDGGFGFGRFTLCSDGRDSMSRLPEPTPSRHRQGSQSSKTSRGHSATPTAPSRTGPSPSPTNAPITVDAIFSAHSDGLLVVLRRTL